MSSTTTRTRSWVLGVVVLLAAAVATVVVLGSRGAGDRPPYRDPAVSGALGLCDASGHQLVSGSTAAHPFAGLAVGSTTAPRALAGDGRTATLYAYQPRRGVEPELWSGRLLSSAGRYPTPTVPAAAITAADPPLADFLTAYPARDGGWIQLRLYLGAPGQAPQTTRYDALDLKVTGTTWHAATRAAVDCSTARSVSLESLVGTSR